MTTTIPTWRRQLIVNNSRRTRLDTCSCGQPILTGLDDDNCAFVANTDLPFLTWAGELAARVVDQRKTYALQAGVLFRRDPLQHIGESANPIVAEHRCGHPIPDTWRQPLTPRRPKETHDVRPPF